MKRPLLLIILAVFQQAFCQNNKLKLIPSEHDLVFTNLASSWDEAVPLGNGMLGVLIWEKEQNLRFSLDRADLWDLRPMANLNLSEWNYQWVYEQWKNDEYAKVQERYDTPYDQLPAPTKIPAGALEFDVKRFGKVDTVRLYVQHAVSEVKWKNGVRLLTFVHATDPIGWFRFENLKDDVIPALIPPAYQNAEEEVEEINSVTGQNLQSLGYKQGIVMETDNSLTYSQEAWGGFKYQIHVKWRKTESGLEGCWSISSEYPDWDKQPEASTVIYEREDVGFEKSFDSHGAWWNTFWQKATVKLPDELLEKQWYLEMYKLGSVARHDTPPISLQAVWTADNGKIPPWKGDFHHDLNTQLSYWPAYSGNHLDLEEGFINWLWKYKDTFKKYTASFYQTKGLNVPGVTTLTGEPMGGWVQYSFSPTVSAWLAHHFYLHWRYSMDQDFLQEKAYPWLKEVATHLDELSVKDEDGLRKLPISSSPEIFNNSPEAWFHTMTNYDLALIHWTFQKAAELAKELGKSDESEEWLRILTEWPALAVDPKEGFMISGQVPYHQSHRHFSHLMAFHPLGIIDWSKGGKDKQVISNTISNLKKLGSDWWTGYSFSWFGNLQARAFNGDGAAEALSIFAEAFCLPNSFHVNGDQSGKGYSKFTYRPFTLEGNFAFAAGIHEMLLQSHTGIVHIFPAIPEEWEEVSFHHLRAEGAFLISAERKNGLLATIVINAEMGGEIRVKNIFENGKFHSEKEYVKDGDIIIIRTQPGEQVKLNAI